MSSLKKRLERLEGGKRRLAPIIVVEEGETVEEAWEKYLSEHPDHKRGGGAIIICGDDISKATHEDDP